MRLAVVTPYFPTKEQAHRGHSAYQTLLHMQREMEIFVVVPLATYPLWARPRNFHWVPNDLSFVAPGGLRARYIEYPALPLISRVCNGLVCRAAIARTVEEFGPDAILNYCIYPEGYAATRIGAKLGVPVILGAIGSDLNRIPDRVSRWWTRRALAGASFVLTVSEHLRRQAIAMGVPPDRSRRVLNGTDTGVFRLADRAIARRELGLNLDARIILYVGWLAPTKGLGELMDAFLPLARQDERLQAICIGDGPMRAEMERRAAEAGLSARLIFPGARPSQEIGRWLAACDIFCLPSWAEGCPNVVVEALACGRPVVSTQVGGIPELVDSPEKGLLVPARDAGLLTEALGRALSQPWDEAAIAARSARDWRDCARETIEICERAVRR